MTNSVYADKDSQTSFVILTSRYSDQGEGHRELLFLNTNWPTTQNLNEAMRQPNFLVLCNNLKYRAIKTRVTYNLEILN